MPKPSQRLGQVGRAIGATPPTVSSITNAILEVGKKPVVTSDPLAGSKLPEKNAASTPVLVPQRPIDMCQGLQQARRALGEFIEAGELGDRLLQQIYRDGAFLPIEGLFIDYKRDVPSERLAEGKLIRHVLAFHNTYGGFLVLGADEVAKDEDIIPAYQSLPALDSKQVRDLCREFFTSPIELQTRVHSVERLGIHYQILVLHIPKRQTREPVMTRRDGPKDPSGKAVFKRDEAYLRDGDNSVPATHCHHWRLLFGARPSPYTDASLDRARLEPLWNDLPDRGFICPEFIGRQSILSELFAWLADDFTCVRVLAGEGGLGKTSIAYQFAAEVARSRLLNVESVVWLTAKKQQFRALINEYEDVSRHHFSTSRELFISLAGNLGETRSEWNDITDHEIPKVLRDAARHVSVFFVIDDLDTLEIDDQKRAIEVCQQLSGLGSRFLFTTRKNATASSATAVEVTGLNTEDYGKLIESWQTRLSLRPLTRKEVERLRETTLGSPLYTESLLRLVKAGMPVSDAVAKWRGNLGIEVRNAALKREVVQLELEAKKVLVAAAVLGEASLAEIKQCTGYSDATLVSATNELQSLFLIHAPAIADQPRFSVSNTTRDLVLGLGPELIPDFGSFQEGIKGKRYKAKGQKADLKVVGIAINQAIALLAARQPTEALRTVDEVNAQFAGKNRDLLFMRGRVLLKFVPPKRDEARKSFSGAFDLGQRKPEFFGLWHDTELALDHFEAAVDVATWALDASVGSQSDWLQRRAHSRLQSAAAQDKTGDVEHTKMQLESAAEDLTAAVKLDPEFEWDTVWRESFFRTHDSLWTVSIRSAQSVPQWVDAFDTQLAAARRGDRRIEVYERLQRALSAMTRLDADRKAGRSERGTNLLAQRTRWCLEVLSEAPRELDLYREFRAVKAIVQDFALEFQVSA